MKYIAMAIGLVLVSGCFSGPSEPQLTEPTNSGMNTFSCKVDGVVWKTKVPLFYMVPPASGLYDGQELILGGLKYEDKIYETIDITLDSVKGVGDQILAGAEYSTGARKYYIPQPGSVKVILTTFDTVNRIASGNFEFSVADDSGNVAKINDGRFDIRYTAQ